MNRLEHYRIRAGLTQTELADMSGIPQSDISRAEKGAKELKGSSWVALAKALGCSLDDLLNVNVR